MSVPFLCLPLAAKAAIAAAGSDAAALAAAQERLATLADASTPVTLTSALVDDHDVMVYTNGTREELLKWDNYCRARTVTV
ncbi:MAG: hypothetical protein P4L40_16985, partial [Terracidiphilus sp.]|nr:hypothetical protein [Terracidiphilus sp.]